MASRKIDDLALVLQKPALDLIHLCKTNGIDLIITCTYRSNQEQADLYAQGRTKPGHIVTHAKAGESAHNRTSNVRPAALAFDVCPIINGKPYWALDGRGRELWQAIGTAGESLGFEWGGRWHKSGLDFPHFQLPNWKNYHEQSVSESP